jgi:hypothetical protein
VLAEHIAEHKLLEIVKSSTFLFARASGNEFLGFDMEI